MKLRRSVLALSALTLALGGAGSAFAYSNGGGNSGDAPGQQNARENCAENIQKQNGNGQTGANTGSANDSKQANTAVTNCDHFWQ